MELHAIGIDLGKTVFTYPTLLRRPPQGLTAKSATTARVMNFAVARSSVLPERIRNGSTGRFAGHNS